MYLLKTVSFSTTIVKNDTNRATPSYRLTFNGNILPLRTFADISEMHRAFSQKNRAPQMKMNRDGISYAYIYKPG